MTRTKFQGDETLTKGLRRSKEEIAAEKAVKVLRTESVKMKVKLSRFHNPEDGTIILIASLAYLA